MDLSKVTREQAIGILWNKGILLWKLDDVQKELYESVQNAKYKTVVWSCSRRLGKSYALSAIAIETCLKKANAVVKMIAPTQKHIKMILRPLFREILKDCPKELLPHFSTQDNVFRFPNGSEIQLAGTDAGHAESLRGGSSDICIVDEAGFCDDLKYIVKSILIPTTTTTGGKIILSSTPPISADHDFVYYMKLAADRGTFVKKTIYDSKRFKAQDIQDIVNELGGEDNPDFRREYLCELYRDENWSVVPEFTELVKKEIIREWPRPPMFDIYVAGDVGFVDLTVILFGYYDFNNAKLVIEDEIVMNGPKMTTEALAKAIKDKERRLYTHPDTGELKKPYLRICDNNLILLNDLHSLHGLTFLPTAKDDSNAALNNLRILIAQRRIIINPRCTKLIYHLENATWSKNHKSYDRSPDAGHYDAIDALKYMVRNVQFTKNPYPSGWGKGNSDTTWHNTDPNLSKPMKEIRNLFVVKRSLK